MPAVDWLAILPLLLTSGLGIAVLVTGLFIDDEETVGWLTLSGLGATTLATVLLAGRKVITFDGTWALDGVSVFFDLLFLVSGILVVLMSMDYIEESDVPAGEYYALVIFAIAGMMTMASGADLIVVFLGLEVMSISVYILAGSWRNQTRSNEAALKYFLLGAFATGFLLYGIALVWGATGSFQLDQIAERVPAVQQRVLLLTGVALLVIGFGFKIAAVPFHMWTPDVYEGAPTSVTALMAVAVKAAGFAAFARVMLVAFASIHDQIAMPLAVLAFLTMTVGNVLALVQRSVKRMLAYSSIAHAGYVLIAIVAGGQSGGAAALFYLLVYSFMTLGAFGVVMALGRRGAPHETLADYAGLGWRSPFLGITMTIFMLSLTGIPPLAGFAGKLYVFTAAVREGWVVLAVLGVINSALSAGYYLRVVVSMYMEAAPEGVVERAQRRPYLATSIVVSAVLTILLGIFPALWLQLARASWLAI